MEQGSGSRGLSSRWRHVFGAAAEQLAVRHLEAHGCIVMERRFRCAGGEVDIVAREGDTLVFVEVKARATLRYGGPAAAVGPRKQRRIAGAARNFLRTRCDRAYPCRFDVVCVVAGNGRAEVRWLKDAFRS